MTLTLPANAKPSFIRMLKRHGIEVPDKPERTPAEIRAAADDCFRLANGEMLQARAALTTGDVEKHLKEARHQLHRAKGLLNAALKKEGC